MENSARCCNPRGRKGHAPNTLFSWHGQKQLSLGSSKASTNQEVGNKHRGGAHRTLCGWCGVVVSDAGGAKRSIMGTPRSCHAWRSEKIPHQDVISWINDSTHRSAGGPERDLEGIVHNVIPSPNFTYSLSATTVVLYGVSLPAQSKTRRSRSTALGGISSTLC